MRKKQAVPKVVEAEAFILRDRSGNARASLTLINDTVNFQMNGPDGTARIGMQVEPSGRAVVALDKQGGQGLVGMSIDEATGNVGIRIANPDGTSAVEMGYFTQMGHPPQIRAFDGRGNVLWESPLSASTEGPE